MNVSSWFHALSVRATLMAGLMALMGQAQATGATIDDFTEHTYSVRAGPRGTSADLPVSRTFARPIQSLKVTIVDGQADDIGFVGSLQVTDTPSPCSRVGAVVAPVDVTSQVTISGATASLLLRAQEGCCCSTGWGQATQTGRRNAQLHWEVTLRPPDPPLDSYNSHEAQGIPICMGTGMRCQVLTHEVLNMEGTAVIRGGGYSGSPSETGRRCASTSAIEVYIDDWSHQWSWPNACVSPGQTYEFLAGHAYDLRGASISGPATPLPITVDPTRTQIHINPKYVILGVTYAPPGSASSVKYSENTMLGNASAILQSTSRQTNTSMTIAATIGPVTGKFSEATSYTQQHDTSSSISLSTTVTDTTTTRGVTSPAGVDHDYDVVWVWLNPALNFNVYSNKTVRWTGYSYDDNDRDIGGQPLGLDRIPIFVGWLNGHFGPMPTSIALALERRWADDQVWPEGEGPGLTPNDLATILAADPFANPDYELRVPSGTRTSADGRFTVTSTDGGDTSFSFGQVGPGGQPLTITHSVNYTTAEATGVAYKTTNQQTFGVELTYKASLLGLVEFSESFSTSQSLTLTNQYSNTRSVTNGQTAELSLTTPGFAEHYAGPTEFVVYQDNLYGTFLFSPVELATPVDLAGEYDRLGFVTDGTVGACGLALDGDCHSYSANLLEAPNSSLNRAMFELGPADEYNAVSAAGQTIPLPAGQFLSLRMLATGVFGSQEDQQFVVTYTDGTSATLVQSLSDWYAPQRYPGERNAVTMPYRNSINVGTKDNRTFVLYGYSFALDSSKVVSSVTLPPNEDVLVVALSLVL
jgi:hypothetical protein